MKLFAWTRRFLHKCVTPSGAFRFGDEFICAECGAEFVFGPGLAGAGMWKRLSYSSEGDEA